ncbi:MAG TPA: hypothetical protein VD694_03205, partial [Nitrososphaeraceae archaeon]|nr:hypothetical protein [Nitrososphaeraceae archaeon]
MVISMKEVCKCVGVSGKVSIVKDFYGYSSVPTSFTDTNTGFIIPGVLSLLEQSRLIKNDLYITLHLRINGPGAFATNPSIDQQINAMRQLYA